MNRMLLSCNLCGVKLWSLCEPARHFETKQHRRALTLAEEQFLSTLMSPTHCGICSIKLDLATAESHYTFKQHNKRKAACQQQLRQLAMDAVVEDTTLGRSFNLPNYNLINFTLPPHSVSAGNNQPLKASKKKKQGSINKERGGGSAIRLIYYYQYDLEPPPSRNFLITNQFIINRHMDVEMTTTNFCHLCDKNLETNRRSSQHYNSEHHLNRRTLYAQELQKLSPEILVQVLQSCYFSNNSALMPHINYRPIMEAVKGNKLLRTILSKRYELSQTLQGHNANKNCINMTNTYCELCQNTFGPSAAADHYNSKRHKKHLSHKTDEFLYEIQDTNDTSVPAKVLDFSLLHIPYSRQLTNFGHRGLYTLTWFRIREQFFDAFLELRNCFFSEVELSVSTMKKRARIVTFYQDLALEESPDPAALASSFSSWDRLNAPHLLRRNYETPAEPDSSHQVADPKTVTCRVCNLLIWKSQAKSHVKRFPHADLASVKADLVKKGITNEFYYFKKGFSRPQNVTCLLCSVLLRSGDNIRSHFNCKSHQAKFKVWCGKELAQKKRYVPKWLTKWHFCKTCNNSLDGTSNAEKHYLESFGLKPANSKKPGNASDTDEPLHHSTMLWKTDKANVTKIPSTSRQTAHLEQLLFREVEKLSQKLYYSKMFRSEVCLTYFQDVNRGVWNVVNSH